MNAYNLIFRVMFAKFFRRVQLLVIAIALMTILASAASANGVRVRNNRFTPLGVRPDVVVRGAGNANVVVNVNGGAFVNNGFRTNRVFINDVGSNQVFFVRQNRGVFVTPNFIIPDNSFRVQVFGGCGGCCR